MNESKNEEQKTSELGAAYVLKGNDSAVKYLIYHQNDSPDGEFIVFVDHEYDLDWECDKKFGLLIDASPLKESVRKILNGVALLEPIAHNWPVDLKLSAKRLLGEAIVSVLQVDEYGGIPAHAESQRPVLWGLRAAQLMTLQETFQIPQSDWIERVLLGIGHGKVHIVEFPATPLEACAALDHSFKALKQAEEKHRFGFYDDAAGKCRLAIEPFFDHESVDANNPESRKIPVLKKHWETKLGKATHDWLKATLGSIKDAANPPHHSPNEHYSQLDSQMILAVTMAVVAYIARNVKPEDLKTP